jgi:hypothetical protein
MSDSLEVHRHSVAGFELPVPARWERTEDIDGCALVAVEPPRDDPHLRANIVVTLERVGARDTLAAWSERSLDALAESLNEARLLDVEALEVGGRPARRALSHYRHEDVGGVNLEQWLVLAGGLGCVVSCSTAALEYDDLYDLMHAVGEGLRIPTEVA